MHRNFFHVFAPPLAAGALLYFIFYTAAPETACACHCSNLTAWLWKFENNAPCRTVRPCLVFLGRKSNLKYITFRFASSIIQITSYLFLTLKNPSCHRPWALWFCGTALLRIDNSRLRLMSMEWDVLWTNRECHLQRRHAVPQFLRPWGAVCQDQVKNFLLLP